MSITVIDNKSGEITEEEFCAIRAALPDTTQATEIVQALDNVILEKVGNASYILLLESKEGVLSSTHCTLDTVVHATRILMKECVESGVNELSLIKMLAEIRADQIIEGVMSANNN